ncbi:MAG: hypothetical protein PHU85_09600 [Phycisphaerae bacterium]|nr:hypothetical protein [Phycisphaerae bacterium]
MATKRLTVVQRAVLGELFENSTLTLDDAAAEQGVPFIHLRKWMIDPEFMSCWDDCRRWRRVRAREQLELAIAAACSQLQQRAAAANAADSASLNDLANALLAQARLLESAIRDETAAPTRNLGWSERPRRGAGPDEPIDDGAAVPPAGEAGVGDDAGFGATLSRVDRRRRAGSPGGLGGPAWVAEASKPLPKPFTQAEMAELMRRKPRDDADFDPRPVADPPPVSPRALSGSSPLPVTKP